MKFYKQNYANEAISIVFVYKRENKKEKQNKREMNGIDVYEFACFL